MPALHGTGSGRPHWKAHQKERRMLQWDRTGKAERYGSALPGGSEHWYGRLEPWQQALCRGLPIDALQEPCAALVVSGFLCSDRDPLQFLDVQELFKALSRGGVCSHNVALMVHANCGYAWPCRECLCEDEA